MSQHIRYWSSRIANGGTGLSAAPTASGQYLSSSAAGTWSISALVANDIPSLDASKITTGVLPIARGGTGWQQQATHGSPSLQPTAALETMLSPMK